jgi:hypothetical protein
VVDGGLIGAQKDPVADGGPERAGFAQQAADAGIDFAGFGPDEEAAMVGGGYAAGNSGGQGGELVLKESGPAEFVEDWDWDGGGLVAVRCFGGGRLWNHGIILCWKKEGHTSANLGRRGSV